jgi:hypothetical protein
MKPFVLIIVLTLILSVCATSQKHVQESFLSGIINFYMQPLS